MTSLEHDPNESIIGNNNRRRSIAGSLIAVGIGIEWAGAIVFDKLADSRLGSTVGLGVVMGGLALMGGGGILLSNSNTSEQLGSDN
jgi:hypothetical protein